MSTRVASSKFWRSLVVATAASITCLCSHVCEAAVTSVIALDRISAQLIPAPPSATLNSLVDGAFVFEEVNGRVLGSDLAVDIGLAGIPGRYFSGDELSPGVIPAGTRVSSALVHFDLPGEPMFFSTAELRVSFDEDILGVIVSDELLDASDPFVGNLATVYPQGLDQRGTTTDIGGGDVVTVGFPLDPFARDLLLELSVDVVLDQVRVITLSPIPEPASFALALLGALALLARLWSRKIAS